MGRSIAKRAHGSSFIEVSKCPEWRKCGVHQVDTSVATIDLKVPDAFLSHPSYTTSNSDGCNQLHDAFTALPLICENTMNDDTEKGPQGPANTGQDQAVAGNKGKFTKGKSGNPAGKPRGARNKTSLMCERLMADDAGEIAKAVIDKATGGDIQASKLILDRLVPPRKGRPVRIDLPEVGGGQQTSWRRTLGSLWRLPAATSLWRKLRC